VGEKKNRERGKRTLNKGSRAEMRRKGRRGEEKDRV